MSGIDEQSKKYLLNDMKDRHEAGRAKYGTSLQPFNGRNHLVDLYQEWLDGIAYLRNEILQRQIEAEQEQSALHFVSNERDKAMALSSDMAGAVNLLLCVIDDMTPWQKLKMVRPAFVAGTIDAYDVAIIMGYTDVEILEVVLLDEFGDLDVIQDHLQPLNQDDLNERRRSFEEAKSFTEVSVMWGKSDPIDMTPCAQADPK